MVGKFGFGTLDSYFGLRLQTQDFRLCTRDIRLRLVIISKILHPISKLLTSLMVR